MANQSTINFRANLRADLVKMRDFSRESLIKRLINKIRNFDYDTALGRVAKVAAIVAGWTAFETAGYFEWIGEQWKAIWEDTAEIGETVRGCCQLVDRRFYHLDTCFLPLPNGGVVYYPPAFDERSRGLIEALAPPELRIDVGDASGGSVRLERFHAGARQDQPSHARLAVSAPDAELLDAILSRMRLAVGGVARATLRVGVAAEDAALAPAPSDGVAPEDFCCSTIYPTDVRVQGRWLRVARQRMDAAIVVEQSGDGASARCVLPRDLRQGDAVVCGESGVRTHTPSIQRSGDDFAFMSSGASSERRVERQVEELALEMRRARAQGGRIVVVAGPVVVHTGGAPHLAQLVRDGYVQALLGGNAVAVHDMETALYGTSLGVDLQKGAGVRGGHRHHLRTINRVRAAGSIAAAVESGLIGSGIMYECVRANVPFALAGSIRDDGPLPDTEMDLLKAQADYARLLAGADLVLMLATMLHAIGVGNMTPAGVRLACVDINPAVVTKLADRGSVESTGIVTDVGLFLKLLAMRLD